MKKKLPKGIRKYIRREKAKIRIQETSLEERKKLITVLYGRFSKRNENKGNI